MSARRPRLALPLAALLLALPALAAAQPAVPPLTGRVVDLGEMLSPQTEAALTAMMAAHEDSTSNQIAVLTVPSLNGEALETYATRVFRTWGLGDADRDNGVLLLIARDDREIRIEVGFGLEGGLTDATAGAIIRKEMTPRFRADDADGGTLAAVGAIIAAIDGEYVADTEDDGGDEPWWILLIFGLSHGLLPMFIGFGTLYSGPIQRYLSLAFTSLFVFFIGMMARELVPGVFGPLLGTLIFPGYPIAFVLADIWISTTEAGRKKRAHHRRKAEAFRGARARGRTSVVVDGISYSVPKASSSSGGGGFSGGGGSSGGGGASGGW